MLRVVGLNYCLAGLIGASGSAYDLRKHCKGAFSGAVVVKIQRHIGKQNSHQRHIGEVVSLGHHLGAKQYVSLVGAEFPQQPVVSLAGGGGVGVHADYPRVRKQKPQLLLYPLSAVAHAQKMFRAA